MLKQSRVSYIRLAKRIAAIGAVFFAVVAASAIFLFWKYQEEIIAFAIDQINKKVNTKITVAKVDLSLKKFPDLSIRFSDVKINGATGRGDTLLSCERMYCGFRFWHVFDKNFKIRQVYLENGRLSVKRIGDSYNYQILKEPAGPGSGDGGFDVERLELRSFDIEYRDVDRNHLYAFQASRIRSSMKLDQKTLNVDLDAGLLSRGAHLEGRSFAVDIPFHIDSKFSFLTTADSAIFHHAAIRVFDSDFTIEGGAGKNAYHFQIDGEKTDIGALLTLLPADVNKDLKQYRSSGEVYFTAHLEGLTSDDVPLINVEFGSRNAQFYHPRFKEIIRRVSLKGSYTNGPGRGPRSSSLKLRDISGSLNGKEFKGDFEMTNFRNPYISFSILADIDAGSALKLFPSKQLTTASGDLFVDLQFSGRLEDVKYVNGLGKVKSAGEIRLQNIDFKLEGVKLDFNDFAGNFLFRDDAVAVNDFSGKIGGTDFLINGFVRNGLAYLLFDETPLIVEADLKSDRIMLTELLSGTPISEGGGDQYRFRISPRLDVDFNCKIGYLEFKRFKGEEISGQLRVQDRKASSRGISVGSLGGRMSISGSVNASKENHIEVFTSTKLQRIDIDQLFYVFEEFGQNFLTSRHLKGQIDASLNTYMVFDSRLRMAGEKLISDISISIKNGELNDFEPIKKLSKYVEEKSLERMRFSELSNRILVQNRNIYLPQMEVTSNVTSIKISGTHTFDQLIDYRVTVPLRRFNKRDSDERFGAIRDDGKGNLNLFLKIVGSTSDYRIVYDAESWKENIKETIREEGQELREVFKTKGMPEPLEAAELNEDEYFDF